MCFDDDFMNFIGFMTDGTGDLPDDDDILAILDIEDTDKGKRGEKE